MSIRTFAGSGVVSALAGRAAHPALGGLCCSLVLLLYPAAAETALCERALAAEPLPLLNGRLTVRLPAGAKNEARQHSIMAAPESNDEETRLVLDDGDARLVLMAYELFATTPAGFEQRVEQMAADWSSGSKGRYTAGKTLTGKGVKVHHIAPRLDDVDPKREAVLMRVAYVALEDDQTLVQVRLYFNPAAAKDLSCCARQCDGILATLARGTRKLNLAAGTRRLEIKRAAHKIALKLPQGFIMSIKDGGDYNLHQFHKLAPFDRNGPRIGTYVGPHPDYQYKQQEVPEENTSETDGRLLGKKVRFAHWVSKDDKGKVVRHMMEHIAPLKTISDRHLLHVFFSAESLEELTEVQKIVEAMELIGP